MNRRLERALGWAIAVAWVLAVVQAFAALAFWIFGPAMLAWILGKGAGLAVIFVACAGLATMIFPAELE